MTPIDFYFKDMAKNIVYLEKVRVRDINHLLIGLLTTCSSRIRGTPDRLARAQVEFDYRLDVCSRWLTNRILLKEKQLDLPFHSI